MSLSSWWMAGKGWSPATRRLPTASAAADVPVLIAVNKTDDRRARGRAVEFYRLGFEPVVEIAAEHGEGTGDLLDEVVQRLPARSRDGAPRLNRKKSRSPSSAARTWGSPRCSIGCCAKSARSSATCRGRPGTPSTRSCSWQQRTFRIVDTAGIRRPAGWRGRASSRPSACCSRAGRSRRPTWRCSCIDASEGATDQDATIAGEAEKAGCGIIIAANKWDLMKGQGQDFSKKFDDELRRQMKFLDYAPVLHISAATGERTTEGARDDRQGRRGAPAAASRPAS